LREERERKREIMRNAKSASVLYDCKGTHTLFTGQRERERERERKGQREWKEGERERVKKREREREKKRGERVLILNGMMGAYAPFSYLVYNNITN
jgi:hypothetical protein